MEMMFSVFHLISLIISFTDPCFVLCNFCLAIKISNELYTAKDYVLLGLSKVRDLVCFGTLE